MQKINWKNVDNDKLNIKQIYLDGSYNEDGIRVLCDFINQQKGNNINIIGIMACLKSKDYKRFFTFFKNFFYKLLFYNVPNGINNLAEPKQLSSLAEEHNLNNREINSFEV